MAFFFFGAAFLNGLGGIALLGTVRTALSAFRNRVNASGPSIISRAAGFIDFIMAQMDSRVKNYCAAL
jgi:hypothetical protein